jgi:hypothetical protein
MLDQQNDITSGLKMVIAEQKGAIAERDELIGRQDKHISRQDELCDRKSASIQFLRDVLREPSDSRSNFIQEPVQVNHSELLLPLRCRHRRANAMNTVMWELEEGVAERKTPKNGSLI